MATDNSVRPIIIKRKKIVQADGHHGGAWKVAYADFVTAMMAFFMLMWLLNAASEQQKAGIANYFSPTLTVNRTSGGGASSFVGDTVFSEDTLMHQGTGASSFYPTEATGARGATGLKDQGQEDSPQMKALRDLEDALKAQTGESALDDQIKKHVITRLTDEGLVVEIFDRPQYPLFRKTAEPTELLVALVDMIAGASNVVTNTIAIEAHVSADPLVRILPKAWPQSIRRAEKARELFLDADLSKERISRITGHGDQDPAVGNHMAIRNNRIEIIFLRE
jgi:chemotaxis protein MotB